MPSTVGILGGMGPAATQYFFSRIIDLTPAQDDVDHVHCLIDNNPQIPSRLEAILGDSARSPAPVMADMARGLERGGADYIVIPCNTAHYYYSSTAQAVDIPVWNAIAMSLAQIKQQAPQTERLGLLATSATHKIKLFDDYFEAAGFRLCLPEPELQDALMAVVLAVKANRLDAEILDRYLQALERWRSVDAVLVACSELSMHYRAQVTHSAYCYDTMELLAQAVVDQHLQAPEA